MDTTETNKAPEGDTSSTTTTAGGDAGKGTTTDAAEGGKAKAKADRPRGGSGEVSGPVDEGAVKMAEFDAAAAAVNAAEQALHAAKSRLAEARVELGRFYTPAGAKRGEKFQVWTGTGAARRMLVIVVTREGFDVSEYAPGAAAS